ncbi:hypothetical protein [Lacinutrix jangbogonensis]|uniref:hypothetical protein n=1 Tax=Lacinutrix jangbogonensis TaxID=1469557 RepID=UPI0006916FFA|nr:hypothetical protein [Lacinutrix jangbogonensis]
MKHLLYTIVLFVVFSCGNEKSVLLPEIQNAEITEIRDVSPAYLFYDETKPDSLELNRSNLIITTNWLVNVDKRLTLKQAIPSIIKLQDKKRNSGHKNKSARNYYTCNDTSIKNLGFIDFTDVVYRTYLDKDEGIIPTNDALHVSLIIKNLDEIFISSYFNHNTIKVNDVVSILKEELNSLDLDDPDHGADFISLNLSFNRNLSFQDYINIKSKLVNFEMENVIVRNIEYIY